MKSLLAALVLLVASFWTLFAPPEAPRVEPAGSADEVVEPPHEEDLPEDVRLTDESGFPEPGRGVPFDSHGGPSLSEPWREPNAPGQPWDIFELVDRLWWGYSQGDGGGGYRDDIEITDAISREFSIYNDLENPVDVRSDANSREFSIYNDLENPVDTATDAISREFSLYNDLENPIDVASDAISREFSIYNDLENPVDFVDAITREFSVHSPSADLRVSEIVAPQAGLTDAVVEVRWTTVNDGPVDATESWTEQIYRSPDAVYGNGNDVLVGTFRFRDGLLAGESRERTATVPLLPYPGEAWFIIVVDTQGDVIEDPSEDNNVAVDDDPVRVQQAPRPDLVVADVTPPQSGVLSGTSTQVSFVVKNQGDGSTESRYWRDIVYLSLDGQNTYLTLGEFANPQFLVPGESYSQTVDIAIPHDVIGTFYIIVDTDGRGAVREGSENNNRRVSAAFSVTLEPQPDLRVDSISFDSEIDSGYSVTVEWADTNAGTGSTDGGYWVDSVYLSLDDEPRINGGDIQIGSMARSGGILQPGNSAAMSASARVPEELNGAYFIKISTDVANSISEFGFESNNVGVSTYPLNISLTEPVDLEPQAIDKPDTALAGHLMEVTWSVENVGPPPVFSKHWTDAVYLSVDTAFEPVSDLLLGTFEHATDVDQSNNPTLDPYAKTRRVRIPDELAEGDYFVIVVVDNANTVFENDGEDNNVFVSAQPTQIHWVPTDLIPEVNFDNSHKLPTAAAAGDTVHLSWRIHNDGDAETPVSTWYDAAYLSTDAAWSNDDIALAFDRRDGELKPGESYQGGQDVLTPYVDAGDYYIIVVTDVYRQVHEQAPGESNNVVAAPFVVTTDSADLLVTSISSADNGETGQPLHVEWTVKNAGTLSTNRDYWYDSVYLSADDALDLGDRSLGSVSRTSALAAGASYTAANDFDLPRDLVGKFHVIVQTDAGGGVFEASESNNALSKAMLVNIDRAPVSDLVVTKVLADHDVTSGQKLTVTWTVKNVGDGPTDVGEWFDAVYLSFDQFIDHDLDHYIGGEYQHAPLDAGEEYTTTRELRVPMGVSGKYYVMVRTDLNNQVYEAGEGDDNEYFDPTKCEVYIPPPVDLVVTEIRVPQQSTLGDMVEFSWDVKNVGDTAVEGSWTDAVYLSDDGVLDAFDVRLGAFEHTAGVLQPGESTTVTVQAKVKAHIVGPHYAFVRTDVLNQIREVDDDNNVLVSDATMDVKAIPLTLGSTYDGDLSTGEELYFALDTPGGETVRITLDHASDQAWTEMYVRYGEVPTSGQYDYAFKRPNEPDQVVTIPTTLAGPYYVLTRVTTGSGGGGETGFSIGAAARPFEIESVAPSSVGAGRVTLRLNGARWDANVKFAIRNSETHREFAPTDVTVVDAADALVRFDLTDAANGKYDVIAADNEEQSELASSLEVAEPTPMLAASEMSQLGAIRRGTTRFGAVAVTNLSSVDIPYATVLLGFADAAGLDAFFTSDQTHLKHTDAMLGEEVIVEGIAPGDTVYIPFGVSVPRSYGFNQLSSGIIVRALSPDDFFYERVYARALQALETILADGDTPPEVAAIYEARYLDDVHDTFLEYGFEVPDRRDDPRFGPRVRIRCDEYCRVLQESRYRTCETYCADIHSSECAACTMRAKDDVDHCYFCCEHPCATGCSRDPKCRECEKYPPWDPNECGKYCFCMRIAFVCGNYVCFDVVEICGERQCFPTPRPADPNEKSGPAGAGEERFVSSAANFPYHIDFENKKEATASAAEVFVTDRLDSAIDLSSFRLGDIHFGDTTIDVPDDVVSFETQVDLTSTHAVVLNIRAGLNAETREAFWTFRAVDPTTGELPEDAYAGFLPPEDGTGRGQGWVEFTATAAESAQTGVLIRNRASIIFDYNEPILTNEVFNTVDADPPGTAVDPLPQETSSVEIPLQVSGDDAPNGSGLGTVSIYASKNGGEYFLAAIANSRQSSFAGERGQTYAFYSRAADRAGNLEAAPDSPDAVTTITKCADFVRGDSNCDGFVNFDDIDLFVCALVNSKENWDNCPGKLGQCDYFCANDINSDNSVDFDDIDGFVECLISGRCP